MNLETLLTPAELPALAQRDLRGTACVVFDILRATSTFVAALHHGAAAIIPVAEISAAITHYSAHPEVLLAGERDGVKIRATTHNEIAFHLGNSPREFMPATVRDRTIVATTTNGTRALRAASGAPTVLAGAFLNLTATARYLRQLAPTEVLFVCAGTGDGVALEDVLAAGALAELLARGATTAPVCSDATEIARQTFLRLQADLPSALGRSRNGRRLLAMPDLRDDVAFCAQQNVFDLVAVMDQQGRLRRVA
jgi:2-phosphosulfolactate phosphatase